MLDLIGHDVVMSAWEAELPLTCFLLGPDSVGKRTAAEYMLRKHYGCVYVSDQVPPNPLSVRAGLIVPPEGYAEAMVYSVFRPDTVIVVTSDNNSWIEGAVLKVYRFTLLPYEDMCAILSQKKLVPSPYIGEVAAHSWGQVKTGLAYFRSKDETAVVVNILRATRTGDMNLLSNSVRGLRSLAMVGVWWTEATTGEWNFFTEADSWECHTNPALMERIEWALGLHIQPSVAGFLAFSSACKGMAR